MKWLDEVMPDNEQWGKFSKSIFSLTEALKDSIEIGKVILLKPNSFEIIFNLH